MKLRIDLPTSEGKTTRVEMSEIEKREDGKRRWVARCRLPMQGCFDIRDVTPVTAIRAEADRAGHDMDDGDAHDDMDSDRMGHDDEMMLQGIASSSSTDWHGTSMSLDALRMMEEQFKKGVPYVASHHDAEWMHMLGQTYDAEVLASAVANAAHGDDMGYMLKVSTTLFAEDERSRMLMGLLKRGIPVGWSIGGWFTEMEVITNEEDEVEAMVVRGVELDHLATTRTPSNPHTFVTTFADDAGDALRAARSKMSDATLETRHVWEVVETEDAIHVVFGKSEGNWKGIRVDEDMEEMSAEEEMSAHEEEMSAHEDEKSYHEGMEEKAAHDDMQEKADHEEMEEKDGHMDEEEEEREATSFDDLPVADRDLAWEWDSEARMEILMSDGGTEEEPNWDAFKMAHFWFDPEAADTQGGYKLAFAKMIDGELTAVPRGVMAALAALNGARGGVDIPDEDREKVYDHIVRYYAKWGDEEPPELRSKTESLEEREIMNYRALPVAPVNAQWSWGIGDAEAVLGVEMDWQRYQMAHLMYEPSMARDVAGYQYPFARMVDGTLQVIVGRVQTLISMLNARQLELGEPDRAKAYEHLVRYVRDAGLTPEPYQSAVDTRSIACSPADTGCDAQRSASLAEITHPTAEGAAMADKPVESNVVASDETRSRLDRIEDLLLRTVEAITVSSVEEVPTPVEPAVAQDSSEVEALRTRLAEMEKRMVSLAQHPVRRGRAHNARIEAYAPASAFESVVRSAETALPTGSALVTVCREQSERRAAGPKSLPTRAQLHADLRSILAAAIADGVITDPDNRAAWR